MTDETKRIVEWLREIPEDARPVERLSRVLREMRDTLHILADAIERGDHLKDKTE